MASYSASLLIHAFAANSGGGEKTRSSRINESNVAPALPDSFAPTTFCSLRGFGSLLSVACLVAETQVTSLLQPPAN
jgi:hypothetical protein